MARRVRRDAKALTRNSTWLAGSVIHRKAIANQSECVTDTPDSSAALFSAFVQETDCHHCSAARSVSSLSGGCRAVQEEEARHTRAGAGMPRWSNFWFFSPPTFTHPLENTVKEQSTSAEWACQQHLVIPREQLHL